MQFPNVSSGAAREKAHIRFFNLSRRTVELFWIDYRGQPVKYPSLQPHQYFDIDTFIGHPWIFRDKDWTFEKFYVQNKEVYFPEQALDADGRHMRKLVFILIPVYSLKDLCLRKIRTIIDRRNIPDIDIPSSLIDELLNPLN